jgi:hypothetical protein
MAPNSGKSYLRSSCTAPDSRKSHRTKGSRTSDRHARHRIQGRHTSDHHAISPYTIKMLSVAQKNLLLLRLVDRRTINHEELNCSTTKHRERVWKILSPLHWQQICTTSWLLRERDVRHAKPSVLNAGSTDNLNPPKSCRVRIAEIVSHHCVSHSPHIVTLKSLVVHQPHRNTITRTQAAMQTSRKNPNKTNRIAEYI